MSDRHHASNPYHLSPRPMSISQHNSAGGMINMTGGRNGGNSGGGGGGGGGGMVHTNMYGYPSGMSSPQGSPHSNFTPGGGGGAGGSNSMTPGSTCSTATPSTISGGLGAGGTNSSATGKGKANTKSASSKAKSHLNGRGGNGMNSRGAVREGATSQTEYYPQYRGTQPLSTQYPNSLTENIKVDLEEEIEDEEEEDGFEDEEDDDENASGGGGAEGSRNGVSGSPAGILVNTTGGGYGRDYYNNNDGASGNGAGPGDNSGNGDEPKKKSTRGSRACTVCRKLKMRCVDADDGPPCKRCKAAGHECVFEESQRGRRSNRKTDQMAKSLKKMELTLENVLKSISHPGLLASGAGMVSDPTLRSADPPVSSHYQKDIHGYDGSPRASEGRQTHPEERGGSLGKDTKGRGRSSSSIGAVPGDHQSLHLSGGIREGGTDAHTPSASSGTGQTGVRFESGVEGDGRRIGINEWGSSSSGTGGTAGESNKNSERRENPRLHSLPDNTLNPLGLLAEASLQNTRKRNVTLSEMLDSSHGGQDDDERDYKRSKLGVANTSYFAPGPMNILPLRRIVIEQRMPPALLVEKIVSVEEVVELFAIFFEHCHRQCPFLDPEVHTPTATGSRSPFLFTCICTVAARYYTKREDGLYRKCLRVAKRVAFDVMTKGFKSTEICQGFLLLCHWNQPAERFEEERTYQFSGIAIRMATDLNLHRKTLAVLPDDVSEETRIMYEREILNRERTWMYCFICDRSVSTQMGKPYSIPKEDFIIRNAKTWHIQRGAQIFDSSLSAMVEMHRIVTRIIDTLYSDTRSVSGLNANLDYPLLMRAFMGQLNQWREDWYLVGSMDAGSTDQTRNNMRQFYYSYYRLFLLSFSIQHALDHPSLSLDLASFCALCFESASTMIAIARDYLGPNGVLKYAIDSTFVYLSYAATFLLKLVSPSFSHIVDEEIAIQLVDDVATTFEKSAVDDTHTPALYASFLRVLIDNKKHGVRTMPNSRSGTRPSSPNPHASGGGEKTGMEAYLKSSRANSMGLVDGLTVGLGGNPETSGTHSNDNVGLNANGERISGELGFDSLTMDSMLSTGGFWSNMLMPGFGGPLASLSGGTGTVLGSATDPWSITPLHSRAGSPNSHYSFPPFDFPTVGGVEH